MRKEVWASVLAAGGLALSVASAAGAPLGIYGEQGCRVTYDNPVIAIDDDKIVFGPGNFGSCEIPDGWAPHREGWRASLTNCLDQNADGGYSKQPDSTLTVTPLPTGAVMFEHRANDSIFAFAKEERVYTTWYKCEGTN